MNLSPAASFMAMLKSSRPLFPAEGQIFATRSSRASKYSTEMYFNLISASILGRIRLYKVYAPTILVVVSILGLKIFSNQYSR